MKTVLIFESDNILRFLYKEELGDEGYHVYASKDDKESLTLLKEKPVDILIAEYQLEPMETYTNLLSIAREVKKIPVIIFTSYPRALIDCEWWGEMEFVSKTSNLNVLKDTMREMLDYKWYVDRFYRSRGSLKQQEIYF
jgi:DNA-binding NtrC family response regulator